MIRCIVSFLTGVVVGVAGVMIAIFMFGIGLPEHDDVLWFGQEGECITHQNLKVFKTLREDRALVGEEADLFLDHPVMLLVAQEKMSPFFDEQVITIPNGLCARHVGNFHYSTKDDDFKTVPVVRIKK